MKENIYIIGHKKPDLDSAVSAYIYAIYQNNKASSFEYNSRLCGEANFITKWLFNKFKQEIPKAMKDISNKKIILVDHTDPEQRPIGWENAEIIEIIDHRDTNLQGLKPPKQTIKKYGSTTTIIAEKMTQDSMKIDPKLASLILSAIIDDTMALRSPNTTIYDEKMVAELSSIAKISDLSLFIRELFQKKESWNNMSAKEIVADDIKEFKIRDKHIIISKIQTMDIESLERREDEFFTELLEKEKKERTALRILMLTDIVRKRSVLLVSGDKKRDLETIFGKELVDNKKIYLTNTLSRKTEIIPQILKYYSK